MSKWRKFKRKLNPFRVEFAKKVVELKVKLNTLALENENEHDESSQHPKDR